jgi:hypothetical protein
MLQTTPAATVCAVSSRLPDSTCSCDMLSTRQAKKSGREPPETGTCTETAAHVRWGHDLATGLKTGQHALLQLSSL